MLYSLLVLLGQTLAVLVVMLVVIITIWHRRAMATVARFVKQGAYSYPGNETFLFGMVMGFQKYMDAIKDNPDKTYPHVCRYWVDEIEGTPRRFNAKKYPLVVMHQVSTVRVWNHDPKVAHDIFKTHNKLTDKIDETESFFKPLLGESIIGMKNNDDWRAKRKACAHGFYKERMKHMMETLKNEINLKVTQWKKEIAENGGST